VKKQIAFFDFDGTLTFQDTLLEFIRFSKGTAKLYGGFLLHSPLLIAYKLKIISNQRAKEAILRFFFRKMPLYRFEEQCAHFAEQRLPHLLRPKGMHEIRQLQEKGFEIVIVSASPANWIRPWTDTIGATLLATRLEIRTGPAGQPGAIAPPPSAEWLTGNISGKNCYGPEKINRIKEQFLLEDYDTIYTYGDTKGDLPMLALGNRSFMKPFR
jgi:phosphatidylglycerophosphatase C